MGNVKPIPEGYHSITPYFIVDDGHKFVEFIKSAFNAEEKYTMPGEDGKIMHAEYKIGDSMIMLSEAMETHPAMPCMMNLYVENSDDTYNKAIKAGATVVREIADQFYGDRSGGVKDPCGNQWWISTHVRDVSEEEMQKAMENQK